MKRETKLRQSDVFIVGIEGRAVEREVLEDEEDEDEEEEKKEEELQENEGTSMHICCC